MKITFLIICLSVSFCATGNDSLKTVNDKQIIVNFINAFLSAETITKEFVLEHYDLGKEVTENGLLEFVIPSVAIDVKEAKTILSSNSDYEILQPSIDELKSDYNIKPFKPTDRIYIIKVEDEVALRILLKNDKIAGTSLIGKSEKHTAVFLVFNNPEKD